MGRLVVSEIVSFGLVSDGDNPAATVELWKRAPEPYWKRAFTTEQRERLTAKGQALPDGSFPIATVADLRNAVAAFGRASNKPLAKQHIIKRARALGRVDALPEAWEITKVRNVADSEPRNKEISMERPDLTSLSDEDWAALDREVLVKAFEVADDMVATLKAQVAELTPEPDPIEKESDEVKAEFAKRDSKIEELEKRLVAETDVRETAEWVTKAKPLEQVLGDPDEAGAKLKEIASAVHEKTMEWLTDRLSKVANVAKQNTRIFKELGVSEGSDVIDQIQALAKEARKSNPDLTEQQARQLVRTANPDLKAAERELARSN